MLVPRVCDADSTPITEANSAAWPFDVQLAAEVIIVSVHVDWD
jgi:hypothetical protein